MGFWLRKNVLLAIFLHLLTQFHVFHAKECTNSIPSHLSSKTLRYQLLTLTNETLKQDMMSYDRAHVNHHDQDFAWSSISPRKMLREENEFSLSSMHKEIKYFDHFELKKSILMEISLHNVRLDPKSLHGRAQQTNLEYLLVLDVDRLAWSFRKTAKLPTPGSPYGGWEASDVELRGHFVGHYLSATAQMWASTHNQTLRVKMTALVSALKECQDAMRTGYLSAFPSEFFDRFEALQTVWAPYYTIHKIMAGLLDQYKLAGNSQALKMVSWMADYFYRRVQNVIRKFSNERHWSSLNQETGGMNDVLYQLYHITGDQRHLVLAHLFDKPCFLGILAMKADHISGFHANTHIPIVVGAQMRYEITGDKLYKEIGTFFMGAVNSSHMFATGGTSVSEFWTDPKRLGDALRTHEDEESCATYNMLKVSRNLFRWTKEMSYAEYYERALTNGVLSIQRGTEPGVMIYMLPLGHGVSKGKSYHGWGNQFNSFWCCYGTGIESFSKLGDSIYFEEVGKAPGLYVIQYISSLLNWTSAQMSLFQATDSVVSWDQHLRVKISVSAKKGSGTSTLHLRIPSWTSSYGLKASLNGDPLALLNPGSFLSISRSWGNGDEVELQFPLVLRTESIQDDRPRFATLQAILYGPYLLAGLSTGDYGIQTGRVKSISDWITPIPADYNLQLVSLMQRNGNGKFFLSNQNQVMRMQASPRVGHDSYVHATFRIISKTKMSGEEEGVIGKSVILEPFDRPGMVVAYSYKEHNTVLTVIDQATDNKGSSTEFLIVKGLNGEDETISLKTKEGCFVYAGVKHSKSDLDVKLCCDSVSDSTFKEAVSFIWNQGLNKYHPISFVAKGLKRSYILEPLLGLRDESYNVYFNVTRY